MVNLKKLRGIKGISQSDLAKELGISRTAVINLENDPKIIPSNSTIFKMCNFFGVSKTELLGLNNIRFFPETKEGLKKLICQLEEVYEKWDL